MYIVVLDIVNGVRMNELTAENLGVCRPHYTYKAQTLKQAILSFVSDKLIKSIVPM